ncbi:thioesterase II family protein [Yinghuangia sp. YIM S10712]|uniref:thioesterase II family protein n=1 Tax=Yinghuangia sp. YIM S10712 TaxID=3436930 RepID=UPI003F529D64
MDNVTADADWIRRYHPLPDAPARLVCFPHAGGSATYFHGVSAALSPDIEVLAVQYPGRQDRRAEPPATSIAELAARVHESLRPWTASGSFAFFGHSMGAVVAFETALLAADGTAPDVLFVSGRRAPSRHREENVRWRDDAGIITEVRELGGTETELLQDEELRRMILPALRADYHAVETYQVRPGARIASPIVALVGDDDSRTTLDEAQAWASHTTGSFDLEVFPGGHFYLNAQAAAVLTVLRARLLPEHAVRPPRGAA